MAAWSVMFLSGGCASSRFIYGTQETMKLRDSMTEEEAIRVLSTSVQDFVGNSWLPYKRDHPTPYGSETSECEAAEVTNKQLIVTASDIQFSYLITREPGEVKTEKIRGGLFTSVAELKYRDTYGQDKTEVVMFKDIGRILLRHVGPRKLFFLIPLDDRILTWNPKYTELYGLSLKPGTETQVLAALLKLCPNLLAE